MAKIQISINDDLLAEVDAFRKVNFISRSGLITQGLTQLLLQHKLTKCLFDMSLAMNKIIDDKTIDEETILKIKDFERLIALLKSK